MSKIAFKPEEATDALKEYTGQIVATDYSEEPFGMKGAPEIKRTGKVLCLQIRTDEYDKPQYEWYRNAVSPLPPQSAFESKEDESRIGTVVCQELYEDFIRWFAGFFDGEGSFCVAVQLLHGKWRILPYVVLSQHTRSLGVLEYIRSWLDGDIRERNRKGRAEAMWRLVGRESLLLLAKVMLPHLQVKKSDCIKFIQFIELLDAGIHGTKEGFLLMMKLRDDINPESYNKKQKRYKSYKWFEMNLKESEVPDIR